MWTISNPKQFLICVHFLLNLEGSSHEDGGIISALFRGKNWKHKLEKHPRNSEKQDFSWGLDRKGKSNVHEVEST